MVRIEPSGNLVAETLGDRCNLEISIQSDIADAKNIILDAVNSFFDGATITKSTDGWVIAVIGDRVDSSQIRDFIDSIRRDVAHQRLFPEFIEQGTDESDASSASIDIAEDAISAAIRSSDERGTARMILEVGFTRGVSPEQFEDLFSQHIVRDISINALFNQAERIEQNDVVVFVSTLKSVPVDALLERLNAFKEDFPVRDVKMTCRPGKKKAAGSIVTLRGP